MIALKKLEYISKEIILKECKTADVISKISWRYAEVRAMGERIIDIEVLKLHSRFEGGVQE